MSTIEAEQFAIEVARIADEHHAEDVVVMDLRGLSSVTDFFVIGTGTSDRQMRTTVDRVNEYAARIGRKRFTLSGYDTARWILADYVDAVFHIFDADRREFYDLELLWGDAPRLEWRLSATG